MKSLPTKYMITQPVKLVFTLPSIGFPSMTKLIWQLSAMLNPIPISNI